MKNILLAIFVMAMMCSCTNNEMLYNKIESEPVIEVDPFFLDSLEVNGKHNWVHFEFQNAGDLHYTSSDYFLWMYYDDPDAFDYENLQFRSSVYHEEWDDNYIIVFLDVEDYEYYVYGKKDFEDLHDEDYQDVWAIREYEVNGDIVFIMHMDLD